jgi:ribosome maturation factor RimP
MLYYPKKGDSGRAVGAGVVPGLGRFGWTRAMTVKRDLVVGKVTGLVAPIIEDMGFELVDVEFLVERGRWVLRIYADKEGGITLDDCVRVSREVGDLLDVKDAVDHEYVLEVSSPGINRPLKKEKDFEQAIGQKVKIRLIQPLGGQRNFTGYLRAVIGKTLHVETTKAQVALPLSEVEKAHLVYEFDT